MWVKMIFTSWPQAVAKRIAHQPPTSSSLMSVGMVAQERTATMRLCNATATSEWDERVDLCSFNEKQKDTDSTQIWQER